MTDATLENLKTCVRPIHDYVVIKRDEPEEKTKGGLIIPATIRDRKHARFGTVLAVGPGGKWAVNKDGKSKARIAPDVKPGDRVIMGEYVREFDVEGEKIVVASANEVLAIVEEE
jgi:chaperonin GroES